MAKGMPQGRRAARTAGGAGVADHRYYDFRSQVRVSDGGPWLERADRLIREWLGGKGYPLPTGYPARFRSEAVDAHLDRISAGNVAAMRLTLAEQTADGEFRTEVLALRAGLKGWLSVSVHNSEGRFVNRPRVVPSILEDVEVRDGDSELLDDTWVIESAHIREFLQVIRDPDRLLPVFVTAVPPGADLQRARELMEKRTRELAGLAHAYVLDAEANRALMAELGQAMGVQYGTIRSFAPNPRPHDAGDAARHRVIGRARLESMRLGAVQTLVGRIARFQAAGQAEPAVVRDIRREFDRKAVSDRYQRPTARKPQVQVVGPGSHERSAAPVLPRPPRTTATEPLLPIATPSSPPDSLSRDIPMRENGVAEDARAARPDPAGLSASGPDEPSEVAESQPGPVSGEAAEPAAGQPSPEASAEHEMAPLSGPDPTASPALAPDALPLVERLLAALGSATLEDAVEDVGVLTALLAETEQRELHELAAREALLDRASDQAAALEELELELAAEIGLRQTAEQNLRVLSSHGPRRSAVDKEIESSPGQLTAPRRFSEIPPVLSIFAPYVVFTGDPTLMAELDEVDQFDHGAKRCWDGLLALYDYARTKKRGEHSRDLRGYLSDVPSGCASFPLSRYAARESETTQRNRRMAQQRVFPVPAQVDPTRRTAMWAHLKLVNVGRVSPRMHFHDDVSGSGSVYVGYIGPHLETSSGA